MFPVLRGWALGSGDLEVDPSPQPHWAAVGTLLTFCEKQGSFLEPGGAFPGSSKQAESHGTAQRSGQEGPGPLATGTALTIFTGWALPVVAAGSEGHGTLIRDLCVRLVGDELPPAPVVGWDHVVVNLLEEPEGGWGGERPARGQPGGAPPDSSGTARVAGSQILLSSEKSWWKLATKNPKHKRDSAVKQRFM